MSLPTLDQMGDILRETPASFAQLPQEWRDYLTVAMRGNPSFSEEQLHWFRIWWLPVTQEQIAELNELCPENMRITGRLALDGKLYIGAYLLTDAVDGGQLAPLRPILENLILTWRDAEDWPESESEE
jgi:hypothetical protein